MTECAWRQDLLLPRIPSQPLFLLELRPMDILAEINRVMELESPALVHLQNVIGLR
jgi:hypothetical protein